MDFELDDQQRALRDEARRFLEAEAPIGYARAMLDDERGWRDDLHSKMAALGWYALPFDEDGGFIPLVLLLVEMGRVVLPGPYVATVALGGVAIDTAGSDEQRARLLGAIGAGEITASFSDDADFVIDGATADVVVLPTENGLVLGAPRARAPVRTLDETRRTAGVELDDGEPLPGDAQSVLDKVAVCLAAEMLGVSERVLELSVEYAKQRTQFGKPIGSFQAIKHRAADMLVDVESLRNAVYYAAWAIDRGHPDASLVASIAKATASDVAKRVTRSGIQIHGGIGFTWEHDMHLFHKRALFDAAAFGDADAHRERVARLLERRHP